MEFTDYLIHAMAKKLGIDIDTLYRQYKKDKIEESKK